MWKGLLVFKEDVVVVNVEVVVAVVVVYVEGVVAGASVVTASELPPLEA